MKHDELHHSVRDLESLLESALLEAKTSECARANLRQAQRDLWDFIDRINEVLKVPIPSPKEKILPSQTPKPLGYIQKMERERQLLINEVSKL